MSEEIAAQCESVATAATGAQAWLEDSANADLVGAELAPLRRQLRRGAMRARRLAQAARRPMCVSVFGPSQAGKSFLVSVLARPTNGALTSNFPHPDGRLDFISQINPEGEGESTGIVTRFTIHSYTAPPEFPVKLRLLSEADVVCILANTFLMDGDKSEAEPTGEELDGLFAKFRPKMGGSVAPGMGPDDVIAIQEYLQKFEHRSTYIAQIRGFWDEAIEIAPYLSIADRAAFLCLVWGRHERFTRLYERLAKALESIGNPLEAYAGLDALQPREDSIIDVKLLNGLDDASGPTLALSTAAGRKASMPKSVATALTAELVLPIADKPHDLFEGTDLLDFPGARTRFEKPLTQFLGEAAEPLKECLLRGKVAYLFDRYVAEQEITSMLLCIPDSNMEVADLPRLIEDWIAHTHGATADLRASAEKLLFFVLTKFDKHLIDSAGASDDAASRFQRRIQASLLEKFAAMTESWPNNWAAGKPFDNCFWLRNPNFPAESVIEYDANNREIALLDRKKDRLEQLKDGCTGAELVKRHFQDPIAAWDAAMALNDGGVTYLIDHMTPVCRPEIKAAQIAAQLRDTALGLSRSIAHFYISDDLSKRLEERRAAAQGLVRELLQVFEHRLFGSMLNALTVRPDQLAAIFQRPPANIRLTAARPSTGTGAPAASGRPAGVVLPGAGIVLPGGGPPPEPAAAPAPATPDRDRVRTLSRPEWRAEVAFGAWIDRVKGFAEMDGIEQRYAISAQAANDLAGELIAGARRLRLRSRIVDALEKRAFLERGDAGIMSAAITATELLNSFAMQAGASLVPPEQRPDIPADDQARKPFAAQPQVDSADALPATPRRADAEYLTSWMHMIYRLFEDNAMDVDGGAANPEQNMRLGAILQSLAAA